MSNFFSPEITLGSVAVIVTMVGALIVFIRRVDHYHFDALKQLNEHEAREAKELAEYRRAYEVRLGVIESRLGDLWIRFIASKAPDP